MTGIRRGRKHLAIQNLDPGLRDLLGDILARLDNLDANAPSLALPDNSITEPKYKAGSVSTRALGSGVVTTAKAAAGLLAATAAGLALMADGFLAASAGGRAKMADGFLSADATGRAKMADSYITLAKVGANIFTANAAGRAKFNADFVDTALIGDDQVTKAKLAGGFLKATTIAGAAAGNHTVTGIAAGDELVMVARFDPAGPALSDDTAEYTISAPNTINNTAGTSSAGGSLLVIWCDLT